MTFIEAIRDGFRNYVAFGGRSRRSAFWWWVLFQTLATIVAAALDGMTRTPAFGALTGLGLFLPGLSVQVRRLHDANRSGWWLFLSLIPVIGIIVLIVWWCTEGTRGPNKYGVDPTLAVGIDAAVFDGRGPLDAPRQG